MDLVRRALGVAKINFLGLSYGTLLGAVYAHFYGSHVRAMVLDGAVDPSVPSDTLTWARRQAVGYLDQFRRFASYCRADALCQWRPTKSPVADFTALEDRLRRDPLRVTAPEPAGTPAHPVPRVGPAQLLTATEVRLLSGPEGWLGLGQMLEQLQHGHGRSTLQTFNSAEDDPPPGSYDAGQCLDGTTNPVSGFRAAARTENQFGPFDVPALPMNGELQCAVWPAGASGYPHPLTAPHSPTILVIGSTADPATPYAGARTLTAQLGHARLLTRNGDGHTAMAFSSCIRAAANRYLSDLTLPPPDTSCPSTQ